MNREKCIMKKEKKIIYINGRFLTKKITGVQRYAIEVVKQLDKLNSDYEFVLLVPKKGMIQNIELNNIEVRKIGNFTGHIWEQISLPIYIIFHDKGDLLNFCNVAPILYPGYITIHDMAFKTHPEHLDRKFSLVYRIITKINIKRYKHIFTVSNFSKKEIIDNYKILDNKITVTYNSAEHLKEIEENKEIINKLGLEDREYCFSLGSKSPHKNHEFMIECAKKHPNTLFVVSGNNNKIFKNENNEKNIKNLIYTGYISDSELIALYKHCKAFIFPSLYEGFGIPPLEAMESGCKNIIVSNIEVLQEIYGNSVKYIDIKNQEYESENIINKINEKIENIDISDKYTWEKTANMLMKKINGKEKE